MTVLVNIYGSAGAGKSTTAMGLTHYLKMKGHKVEYVSEYAKDLVNEGSEHKLKHQLYVFAKQLKRLEVVMDKGLDFVVTDSPILLGYFYGLKYGTIKSYFKDIITSHINDHKTISFFINRDIEYDPNLRVQSEKESDEDSENLLSLLKEFKVDLIQTKSKAINTISYLDSIYEDTFMPKDCVNYETNNKIVESFLLSVLSTIKYREELLKDGLVDIPRLYLGRRQGHSTSIVSFIKQNPHLNICVVSRDTTTFKLKDSIPIFINNIDTSMFNGKDFDLIIIEPHVFSNKLLDQYIPARLLSRTVFVGD